MTEGGRTPEQWAEWILEQMEDPEVVAELAVRCGLPASAPADTVLDVLIRRQDLRSE